MLFTAKTRPGTALLAIAVLAVASLALHQVLDLSWNLHFGPEAAVASVFGLAAILFSDGFLHGFFSLALGKPYLKRFGRLVRYFSSQGPMLILAGGVTAAAEELFFRGVLLQGLTSWGTLPALLVSSLLFGLAHLIPTRGLWVFAIWAAWEGAIIGTVFLATGSLAVVALVHGLHDVVGFSIFAFYRRRGWYPA